MSIKNINWPTRTTSYSAVEKNTDLFKKVPYKQVKVNDKHNSNCKLKQKFLSEPTAVNRNKNQRLQVIVKGIIKKLFAYSSAAVVHLLPVNKGWRREREESVALSQFNFFSR